MAYRLLLVCALWSCLPSLTLAQPDKLPPLCWGGDAAGGAPFIYGPPEKRVGFEVEMIASLAKRLGRRPVFVQADWDTLPDALARGNIDIALNGMEYLPEREKEFPSTHPYFVYTLRLIARRGDTRIRSWDDLLDTKEGKKRIGVLRGSVAERYLRDRFPETIEVVPTKEVDETFQLVEDGKRLEATVQDSPAAVYYVQGGKLPNLKVVDEAVAPGYYVMLTRPGDAELRKQLDRALLEVLESGELEQIYCKYHLWSQEQEKLQSLFAKPWPPEQKDSESSARASRSLAQLWPAILKATGLTIALALCAMPLAIALGVVVAVGRLYGPWFVRWPLAFYVEVLRGTPFLLQIYVLFYLVPLAARWTEWEPLIVVATLNPFIAGVLGLAINYSANEAENYRAGLQAIPPGQMEAGLCLGMSRFTVIRRIILPQAMRLVIPPVTNDFIALFKDTSICSAILLTELTGLYYQNKWDRAIAWQLALVVAVLYLAMSYPLAVLARWLERDTRQVHA